MLLIFSACKKEELPYTPVVKYVINHAPKSKVEIRHSVANDKLEIKIDSSLNSYTYSFTAYDGQEIWIYAHVYSLPTISNIKLSIYLDDELYVQQDSSGHDPRVGFKGIIKK